MCCNGGLYGRVDLDDDDRKRLAAAGFNAPERLQHPCQYFDGQCSVYAIRPKPCRKYRCKVLESFIAGEIDRTTAQSRVDQALALREKMKASAIEGRAPHEIAEQWSAEPAASRSPGQAQALLAYVVYWTYAERYFLRASDRRVTRLEA